MTISSLRTIRTAVFASSPVRVMSVQPSRHRWRGVLKFSARSAISLPNGSDERSKFGNHQISDLFSAGVSVMAKFPPETRRSAVRSLYRLVEFSRIPQFPNPSTDFAVFWPACAHVADADFAFYVRPLSDGRFCRGGCKRDSRVYGRP